MLKITSRKVSGFKDFPYHLIVRAPGYWSPTGPGFSISGVIEAADARVLAASFSMLAALQAAKIGDTSLIDAAIEQALNAEIQIEDENEGEVP